jgi:hypothetical protein
MKGRILIAGLTLSILAMVPCAAQATTVVKGVIDATNITGFAEDQEVEISIAANGFAVFANKSIPNPGGSTGWFCVGGVKEPLPPALSLASCRLVFSNVPGTMTAPKPHYMFVRIELSPTMKVAAVKLCPTPAPCWTITTPPFPTVSMTVTSITAD